MSTPIEHDIFDVWFNDVLKDIYDTFRATPNYRFLKQTLYDMLPDNFKTDAKTDMFNLFGEFITEAEFVKFLHKQTLGADYISFDYLVRYYNVKLDSNYMPKFNEVFQFDNGIKKEALYIWSIQQNVKRNPDLKIFNANYFVLKLQNKLELEDMSDVRKMNWDAFYEELDNIVEIDENHKGKALLNDNVKNNIMKQNGINYSRLNHQMIYKGEIKSGTHINAVILDNKYYARFLVIFICKLTNALLLKYKAVREHFIMKNFKKSLFTTCNGITLSIINLTNQRSADDLTYRQMSIIDKTLVIKHEALIVATTRLAGINTENFIALFNCKDGNPIEFSKVLKLLRVEINDIRNFKEFLCRINVIDYLTTANNAIFLNWKQLNLVITDYDSDINLKALNKLYSIGLRVLMKQS